jgi:pimeloyl-ACP methyl ester carboxylesterase
MGGAPELDFDEEEDALLDGPGGRAVGNLRTWLNGTAAAPLVARTGRSSPACSASPAQIAAYERGPAAAGRRATRPPSARSHRPTLVVACAHDQPAFRALAEWLAGEIPNAEGALLEAAHLPSVERPDELSRLVLDYLARAGR